MTTSVDDEDATIDALVAAVGQPFPDQAPDERRAAAVALVGALRRRRERGEPPRDEVLTDVARAVHRLRVIGHPEEILRSACHEAARVSGLERVALSALAPDGGFRVIHSVGDPGLFRALGARLEGTPTSGPFPPGSPEATAVKTREPMVGGVEETDAASGARSLGPGTYVVVPILRSGAAVGLLHGAHHPPAAIDAYRVAGLAAFAAVFASVWHSSAIESRWAERAGALTEAVDAVLERTVDHQGEDFRLYPGEDGAQDADDQPTSGADTARGVSTSALTPRERVVLDHILAGDGNREIADALVLSVDTVKTHVKKILRKLGAANRADLISRNYRGTV